MIPTLKGLKQIADIANPVTLRTLKQAGAIGDPRGALALARGLPWLLGRGPSLGVVVQMHGIALADKPAIHDVKGTLTWHELDRRANQFAHALQKLGLEANDRIALVLRNGRDFVTATLGAQKVGIATCPLNTFAKPRELDATLQGAAAKVIVYDTKHVDQLEDSALDSVHKLFVGSGEEALPDSRSFDDIVSSQPDSPPPPFTTRPGIPRVIIQTSGTTGRPKGASRDASGAGLGTLANLLQVVPYHRDDVILCPAPLFHSFGLATLTFATAIGATLVLPRAFDPQDSLSLIEQHRATAASFIPVMIRRILSLPDDQKSRYDLSSLRIVLASGSAMGQDLRRETTKLFGHALYDLYGSTEAGWITIATPDDIAVNPKSAGKPSPGVEVTIFSREGRRLPPGETGEIHVKSKFLFEGYTTGDKKDEREGFMAVGDLGRLDHEGYLYVESRADDMVVVGGENVYPIEVEDVITSLEGVSDAAVIGIEDEEYGQVLAAFVEGLVAREKVLEACRADLASYKVPKRVEIMEELPRTGTGKVLKRDLLAQLAGERAERGPRQA